MGFDYKAAKKAGYSEAEIADYLGGESGFNVAGARKAGFSDEDIIKSIRARNASFSEGVAQAIENAPASAKRLAGSLWDTVTSPLQSLDNIGKVVRGMAPGVFTAATEQDVSAADTLKAAIAARYGSGAGIKETAITDPIGMVADIAGLLTGGGAALKASGLARAGASASAVGSAIDPVALAGRVASYPARLAGRGVATVTEAAPEVLMVSGLKPSSSIPLEKIDALASAAVRERIPPTRAGLNKARALKDSVGKEIGAAVDTATAAGAGDDPLVIMREALAPLRERVASGSDALGDLAKVDEVERAFLATRLDADGNPLRMTARDMQNAKKDFGKKVGKAYDKERQDNPLATQAREAAAAELRTRLEGFDPSLEGLNAQWGDMKMLSQAIESALKRTDRNNVVPTRAMFGGAAGGPLGLVLGGITDSLPFKGQLAFGADWARNSVIPQVSAASGLVGRNLPDATALARLLAVGGQGAWQ